MHAFDAAYLHLLAVWLYALASLTFAGASAYPVMLTGHAAEDVMKDKWYVVRDAIAEHEEAGEAAMWVLIVMGVGSGYAWWRMVRREPTGVPPVWLGALVLALSLVGVATTTVAAYRGGNIVYYSPKLASPPR